MPWTPLRDDRRAGQGSGVFRDVTEQELAESALRASQSMFRLITDHISDLIAVIDLDGRRIYNSASYERILGAPSALYRSDSFADVHPDDRDFIRRIFAETIRTGIGQRAEYRLVSANGECVYVESVGSVIKDAAGKVEKVLVVSRDIGERRHAEARIRSEKEFSETLINSMPGIFYLYDWGRTILRWNKNFETVTGYTAEEIPRLDPLDFFAPEQKQLVHQRMLKCFAEGSADVEVFIVAKDGRRTPFYVTGLRIAVGERHCMLGVGIDISERLRAEPPVTMRRLGRQNKALSSRHGRRRFRGPILLAHANDHRAGAKHPGSQPREHLVSGDGSTRSVAPNSSRRHITGTRQASNSPRTPIPTTSPRWPRNARSRPPTRSPTNALPSSPRATSGRSASARCSTRRSGWTGRWWASSATSTPGRRARGRRMSRTSRARWPISSH